MTKIEWADESWNPIRARNLATGGIGHFCAHVSEGCRNCYAETMQRRFDNPIRYAAQDLAKVEVFLDENAVMKPLGWRKPRRVFVCSMTDLFAEWHDDAWIDRVFALAALCPEHKFLVLTKRPERMRAYMRAQECVGYDSGQPLYAADAHMRIAEFIGCTRIAWPLPNVWLGVSAEDQATARSRIPELLATPAAVHFVSYEPALGPVDLTRIGPWSGFPWHPPGPPVCAIADALAGREYQSQQGRWLDAGAIARLDWIIGGGESGPGARPFDLAWARSVVAQCRAAGVPVFVKQLGARPVVSGRALDLRDAKGGDPAEWPPDLRVREWPG